MDFGKFVDLTYERVDIEDYKQTAYIFRAYCYNATWDQYDHGEIGIVPYENTIIRVW